MTDTTATPESGAPTSTAPDAQRATPASGQSAAYWEQEARNAFATRDAAKAELSAIRTAEQEASAEAARKLAEAGNHKALYEQELAARKAAEAERDQYAPFYQAVKENLEAKKAALDDSTKALLADVPLHAQVALIDKLISTPTTVSPSVPPTHAPGPSNGAVPRYGTPEWKEWQRTEPDFKKVREARKAQFNQGPWRGQ